MCRAAVFYVFVCNAELSRGQFRGFSPSNAERDRGSSRHFEYDRGLELERLRDEYRDINVHHYPVILEAGAPEGFNETVNILNLYTTVNLMANGYNS